MTKTLLVVCAKADSLINFRYELLELFARNYRVVVAAPEFDARVKEQLSNIKLIYQPLILKRTKISPLADLLTMVKLWAIIKKHKPHKIFLYGAKPVVYVSLVARAISRKIEVYSMIAGLGSYFIYKNFKARLICALMCILYRYALACNRVVFFQNNDDVTEFLHRGLITAAQKYKLLPGSGVNLQRYGRTPLTFTSITVKPKVKFLCMARLLQDKGIAEYVAAAKILKTKYEAECDLAGIYENKPSSIAAAQIHTWQQQGIINFLGEVSAAAQVLAQYDVFVLPSYREGLPKSVLEAMACGRVIITTDVPGCRQTVIGGVNGLLVPAQDINNLVRAMQYCCANPYRLPRMGLLSRRFAEACFDVHKVNAMIMQEVEG